MLSTVVDVTVTILSQHLQKLPEILFHFFAPAFDARGIWLRRTDPTVLVSTSSGDIHVDNVYKIPLISNVKQLKIGASWHQTS